VNECGKDPSYSGGLGYATVNLWMGKKYFYSTGLSLAPGVGRWVRHRDGNDYIYNHSGKIVKNSNFFYNPYEANNFVYNPNYFYNYISKSPGIFNISDINDIKKVEDLPVENVIDIKGDYLYEDFKEGNGQ